MFGNNKKDEKKIMMKINEQRVVRSFLDFVLRHTPKQQARLCFLAVDPVTLKNVYVPINLDSPDFDRLLKDFVERKRNILVGKAGV